MEHYRFQTLSKYLSYLRESAILAKFTLATGKRLIRTLPLDSLLALRRYLGYSPYVEREITLRCFQQLQAQTYLSRLENADKIPLSPHVTLSWGSLIDDITSEGGAKVSDSLLETSAFSDALIGWATAA